MVIIGYINYYHAVFIASLMPHFEFSISSVIGTHRLDLELATTAQPPAGRKVAGRTHRTKTWPSSKLRVLHRNFSAAV